jgi:Ca2+-binding RTX toxin-like protein
LGDIDDNVANIFDGGAGDDTISGGAGNDTLYGGAGNDLFYESLSNGNDTIDGGDGIDTVDYSDVTNENLIIDLNSQGDKTISVNQGRDTFISIEGAIGGKGDDILIGTAGANTLIGGYGDDTVDGGAGNDQLYGGEGSDTVDYSAESSSVTVDLLSANKVGQGSSSGVDNLYSIENIIGTNLTSLGDLLIGDAGKNTIYGLDGNDTIYENADDDFVEAGAGNDYIYAGAGEDHGRIRY